MVSMLTTSFNIQKLFVLPTEHIDLFCVILTQPVIYGGKTK